MTDHGFNRLSTHLPGSVSQTPTPEARNTGGASKVRASKASGAYALNPEL